jgi:RimJ/RimL family protein N-acetyltransferase
MKYQTARVRLRPVRAADAKVSIAWRNDPDVRDFALGYRFPVTVAMERAWYTKALSPENKDVHFAIEDRADGAYVGVVSLTQVDLISRHASFGIVVGDTTRQGRGLGRDATRLALDYGFGMLNLNRIYLHVPWYNARAKALYRSLGFRCEGVMRQHVFINSRYCDLEVWALLAEEDRARRQR